MAQKQGKAWGAQLGQNSKFHGILEMCHFPLQQKQNSHQAMLRWTKQFIMYKHSRLRQMSYKSLCFTIFLRHHTHTTLAKWNVSLSTATKSLQSLIHIFTSKSNHHWTHWPFFIHEHDQTWINWPELVAKDISYDYLRQSVNDFHYLTSSLAVCKRLFKLWGYQRSRYRPIWQMNDRRPIN